MLQVHVRLLRVIGEVHVRLLQVQRMRVQRMLR